MQPKKRYAFFKVLLVVTAVNIFFYILNILVVKYLDSAVTKESPGHIFSAGYIIKQIVGIILMTFFYYVALNWYNRLIVQRKGPAPYVLASCLFFVMAFSYFAGMHYLYPQVSEEQMGKKSGPGIFMFSFTISSLFCTGIALLLAYLNNLRDEKTQRKILEAQKLQLEVDKSQANFKFLKSQINPHFLHNTLNFLYAKSLPYSAELSEGILTLSDIMRYALNEAVDGDDKALLKDEIEHVRNVIKINQLRFSNNLNVNFEVNGVLNGATIIPFVLITIVENAFKHGDLQKPEYPIDIKLSVEHSHLYFYCRNKKKSGPKEISTGLGLDNIRNRLDFAYGSDYKLKIKDEADFYTTELLINKL